MFHNLWEFAALLLPKLKSQDAFCIQTIQLYAALRLLVFEKNSSKMLKQGRILRMFVNIEIVKKKLVYI